MSGKPKPPEDPGCPAWMVSFGDAISLLVTFFVMLLAFSDFEDAKLMELLGALKGGFRVNPSVNRALGTSTETRRIAKNVGADAGSVMIDKRKASKVTATEVMLQKRFARNTVGDYDKGVVIRLLDEGMSVIIQTQSLFKEGSAELLPSKDKVVGVIADMALDLENEVRIIGIVPDDTKVLSSKVKTPWGLAAERSLALKNALVEMAEFQDNRFSLGARVESGEDQLITRKEKFPPDRMEVLIVGFRDTTIVPEELILQNVWE